MDTYFKSIGKEKKSKNLKSMIVNSKRGISKKSKIDLIEYYDSNGNIIYRKSHPFYNQHNYREETFSFDSSGRISKIIRSESFRRHDMVCTDLVYSESERVKFVITSEGNPNELKYDTIEYSYFPDSKIKYRTIRNRWDAKDTFFYHYNSFGDIYIDDKARDTVFNFKIRNGNGCVIGFRDTSSERITIEKDSFCNRLKYNREILVNSKWILITKEEYRYNRNFLLEEKYYKCGKQLHDKCRGKLKMETHKKFEYDNSGNIYRVRSYNAKGKIIETQEFTYEYGG